MMMAGQLRTRMRAVLVGYGFPTKVHRLRMALRTLLCWKRYALLAALLSTGMICATARVARAMPPPPDGSIRIKVPIKNTAQHLTTTLDVTSLPSTLSLPYLADNMAQLASMPLPQEITVHYAVKGKDREIPFSVTSSTLSIDPAHVPILKTAFQVQLLPFKVVPSTSGCPRQQESSTLYLFEEPAASDINGRFLLCTQIHAQGQSDEIHALSTFQYAGTPDFARGAVHVNANGQQVLVSPAPGTVGATIRWTPDGDVIFTTFLVKFWPRNAAPVRNVYRDLDRVHVDTAIALATDLESWGTLCVDVPPGLNVGDVSQLLSVSTWDSSINPPADRIVEKIKWRPNPPNVQACVVLLANNSTVDEGAKPIIDAFLHQLQAQVNAQIQIQAKRPEVPQQIRNLVIEGNYHFSDAMFLDDGKSAVTSLDVNRSIATQVSWLCLQPNQRQDPPPNIQVKSQRIIVRDLKGNVLMTFGSGATSLTFDQSLISQYRCASIGGNGLSVALGNDGKASDDVRIYIDDIPHGKPIKRRYAEGYALEKALRNSFVVAGVSQPLCPTCSFSFLPNTLTTIRAAMPLVEAWAGYPHVISGRFDMGVTAGMFIGSDSTKDVQAVSISPFFASVCLSIDTPIAPRICGMFSTDVVFSFTTPAGATAPSFNVEMLPNVMALVGAAVP